ncbi:WD repeat and coiled-coil-containing protein-like [Corticium candelabrum]|uniref:WD repeat and coiled-coil-containing protein-like n=1 Tax=Corticium candelabrum TaxID=121492 RepID=UPI002E266747|nr:WD repeat and coiled-coil-containing protein-like [Corticium candelabrum]
MDACLLGACSLKTTGVNYLEQAVSIVGNVLWYDGRVLWMSNVCLKHPGTLDVKSRACGELNRVIDVSWSSCGHLMAVLSEKNVALWRLTDDCKKFNKIMEERNETGATRCLWHYKKPIVSFQSNAGLDFYEVSSINCIPVYQWKSRDLAVGVTCWMPDGGIIVTSKRSIYKLNLPVFTKEADGTSQAISHVLTLKGQIRALVVSHSADLIMVATDLQLDLSNAAEAENMFEEPCFEKRDDETPQRGTELSGLRLQGEQSSLFHFRRRQPSHNAALVYAIRLSHSSATSLCSSHLPGIMTPDLICFNQQTERLVVGSTTFRTLYIFVLRRSSLGCQLELVSKVEMGLTDRPKGLCWNSTVGTLVLVGKLKEYPNCAFLTTSVVTEYELFIRRINVESQYKEDATVAARESAGVEDESHCELTDLKMPDGHLLYENEVATRASIQEIEDEPNVLDGVCDFDGWSERQLLVAVLKDIRLIKHRLLHQSAWNRETRDPSVLPSVAQMPVVYVTAGRESTRRTAFLLCGKQLKLSALQTSFCMERIAMVVEGMPDVVLTAGSDGFIPLKFEPDSEITVYEVTSD